MATDRVFHVLLAEDEQFQRLALLDILTLCDYDVTITENGKLAYDELKDETKDFDLVLLDLFMPEMDGFELLSLMQEDERLRHIPVVVMSANDNNDIVGNCLKMGAKDYLVKPIRIQECKALVRHMKQLSQNSTKAEKGLFKYENIRPLGQGAAGSVTLVRNKLDGLQYALKQIQLLYLNEKDKKSAENEVQFLRVLQGPTLIKFVESFIENNSIYIVMEYADGGSLAQRIQKYIHQGKQFSTDDILRYLAQITLGVMAMHSKNILHRDIKTQNIFITQNDILKIGDFGISKQVETINPMAMTACGTPYFMPPEVCQGKPYDSKADVWAVGVILYELITLKKPFDSDSINGVFEKIVKQPIEPLPQSVDSNLKMLVGALLNKDYNKRPNIFEVAKIPCVRKQIIKFVDENNFKEEVMNIMDIEEKAAEKLQPMSSTLNEEQEQPALQTYMLEQLGEWAELIKNDVRVQDYKNGWFGKHLRCVFGGDIYRWILDHVESNEKKAKQICNKMLEKEIIQNVEGRLEFSTTDLYRLYMDREDIADNLLRKWKDAIRGALEVSVGLVNLIEQVYNQAIVQDEEENAIDVDTALKSTQYKAYLNAVCELERVNIQELGTRERIAFFLNIYQCMYVHYFLKMMNEGQAQGGESYLSKIKSFVWNTSAKPFFYNISGLNFSLEEIKHGMLRNNKKSPAAYMRTLSWGDPKTQIIKDLNDPRINFVCQDFPDIVEHMDSFPSDEDLSERLDQFVSEIVNDKLNVDTIQGEITLPKVLSTYRADFGGSDETILKFVFKYYSQGEIDEETAMREICHKKSMIIRYQ